MAVKASSQVTLIDVSDSYSVTLTSEAYTFTGGTSGADAGLTCSTQAQAYCGTSQCTSVSITASAITCPTGITAAVTNNGTSSPTVTFTTTATITASCEATIPVVVNGITINKKFSFAVAKTGATGAKGTTGATGATGATGKTALQPTRNWSAAFKTVGETASCSTSDFNRTPVVGDTFMNIDGGSNTGTWKVTAISGTTVTIQLLSYVNSKGATGATSSTAKRAGAIKASAAITAGNLIVGNSSGYHHLKTGGSFDISYGVLYANSAIASGSTGSDNYTTINFTVTTTQSLTLTAYKAVYIKGKLTGPTFTPVSTAPLTQTVPTTADGYFYMLVGTATSTTTISLCEDHAVYRYLNGKFQAMGSTADETVLNWCKNSDLTYIDGGKLYANSVTAAKINTTDLFAQTVTATNMTITGNSVFKGKLSGASGDFSGALTAQSLTLGDGTVKMTWGTDIYNEYAAEIYYNNNYAPWTGLIVHNEGVVLDAYAKSGSDVSSQATVDLEATGYVGISATQRITLTNAGSNTRGVLCLGNDVQLQCKKSESATYAVSFGVGAGGTNRGIYDDTKSSWMIYRDASNTYVDGVNMTVSSSGNFRKWGRVVMGRLYGTSATSPGTIPSGYRPVADVSVAATMLYSGKAYQGYVIFRSSGAINCYYYDYGNAAGTPASGATAYCTGVWVI